jgi:hypothetical protein
LADGRVLVTGGYAPELTATAEIYDPATGIWSNTGAMGTGRVSHTSTLLWDGRVLVSGGWDASGSELSSAEVYDPATGTWSPAGSMNARARHTATLLSDGQVLVASGYGAGCRSAELYDATTGTWSITASTTTDHCLGTATLLSDSRVLVAAGGFASATAEIYSSVATAPEPGYTGSGTGVAVTTPATLPSGAATAVSLNFDTVTSSGTTSVTTSASGPPPPSGFKLTSPPVYYQITTTATFSGGIRVCLNWSEGQVANENNVRLFHNQGGAWVNITDVASINAVTNTVCGTTTSLSPFTLFEVKYPFAGFYAPVDNGSTVNAVKAGAAVPVRFSLGGDNGLNIFWSGYPRVQVMLCATGGLVDVIEETVNAGGSSLSYDPTAGRYTYVWKTDKSWAGTCRQLQVKLADGETYTAQFTFR